MLLSTSGNFFLFECNKKYYVEADKKQRKVIPALKEDYKTEDSNGENSNAGNYKCDSFRFCKAYLCFEQILKNLSPVKRLAGQEIQKSDSKIDL